MTSKSRPSLIILVADVHYFLKIMRFRPTITFEQYRDTCLAIAAAKPKEGASKASWKAYVSLGLACLALGLSPQIPGARVPALIAFSLFVLLGVLSKPFAKRSQDRCFRKVFSEEQAGLNNQTITIDESGISCDMSEGQATSHHAWQAFINRIDTPDAYIFLPSPNSFIRVPKEALTSSEVELVSQWSSLVPDAKSQEIS